MENFEEKNYQHFVQLKHGAEWKDMTTELGLQTSKIIYIIKCI